MNPNWKQIVREHLAVLRLPPERESEIVEELALYLEAAYEDALAAGLSEVEAEARAVQNYDWRLLECEVRRAEQPLAARTLQAPMEVIEQTVGMRMESFIQDLRFGVRMLMKSPGFTLIAVLTLALGIGANTALFSVINGVLLRPLAYHDPDRLVWLGHKAAKPNQASAISPPTFVDYRNQCQSFENLTALMYGTGFNLTGDGEPERLQGRRVSANFFDTLGVAPALGRGFLAEEDAPERNRVVVLSHGLWQRRFGADQDIVGKALRLDGQSFTVVGIMPAAFRWQTDELWTPLALGPEIFTPRGRGSEFLQAIARLKPQVTLQQAQAEVSGVAAQIVRQNPKAYPTGSDFIAQVKSLHEDVVSDVRLTLLVLFGAVCFVLLIACSNVANLLLARASARRKEIAVRASLGASRFRLIRQMLTESLSLALLSGLGGLLLARLGIDLLLALNPANLPRLQEIAVDARALGFLLGLALLALLLCGLAPALQASKTDLQETLKEGDRGASAGRQRTRSLIVVAEVAMSLVLLAGAGLMIRSFLRLTHVDPGFAPDHVLTAHVGLPASKYPEPPQRRAFFQQTLERIRALPGVISAGAVDVLPLGGGVRSATFAIEGRATGPNEAPPHSDIRTIAPGYFQTMKIPLLKGRDFTEQDNADGRNVAMIDETLARLYWPGEDPIGKRLNLRFADNLTGWREIVGVVESVKHKGLDAEYKGQIFYPLAQGGTSGMYLVARTTADPLSLVSAVRGAIRTVDPERPVYRVRTMEQIVADAVAQPRLTMLLLGAFAVLALVLAAVGIYGVLSYAVTQRTHEIGIRMALGARQRDVLKLVVKHGMLLTLLGALLGLIASFALTRFMQTLLFGISPNDPLTFIAVAFLLAGVALIACYIPARRATKVDPLTSLRHE
jgi:putative ABC transport system permease protein